MDFDFQIFQMRLLLSLRQTVPLDENLRAVMSSSLAKLKRFCGASLALHVFINVEVQELHAMVIGKSEFTQRVLDDELERIYEGDHDELIPRSKLPQYSRLDLPSDGEIINLIDPMGDTRLERTSHQMANLFQQLAELFPQEFADITVSEGDSLLVLPLGTDEHRRLGGIMLWSRSGCLQECFQDYHEQERILSFKRGIEQLLIGLFTNFYQMTPHTYLPSYYRVERKPVALLCAEIRDFDRVSEILRQRYDFERDKSLECLSRLVNRFSEKAAEVVERVPYRGRVDQIWGNGLLAVFGEYMDIQEPTPRLACMRAVAAAADLVEECSNVLDDWLENDFQYEHFLIYNNEHISLNPVVAVDYGEVVFDYVGSLKNRFYMSIGDHVNFVKQLASAVGNTEPSIDYNFTMRLLPNRASASVTDSTTKLEEPPIILSQASFTGSKHILKPLPTMTAKSLEQPWKIRLPGRHMLYSVYQIWPENVDRTKL